MYFYLSKILGFFVLPSNLMAGIVICGLLSWLGGHTRLGRRLTVVGAMLLLFAGMAPLGTVFLLPLENRFPQWDPAQGAPDGIIILGGVVNGYISRLRHGISLDSSVARLTAAIDLARQYPTARVLFSGGNANMISPGMTESVFAVRFLEQYGVAPDRILVDRYSRNTMENAVNAKKIAAPKPGERWLLVTSASHMPRAMGLFRAAGFPVEAYPVDWKTGGWRDLRMIPYSMLYDIPRLDFAAHEWEGLFIDWILGRSSALFPGPANASASN